MATSVYTGFVLATFLSVAYGESICNFGVSNCSTGCCGVYDSYSRCCSSCCIVAASVVGIVLGCIGGFLGLVTVLVVIFCCCRPSRGATGRTFATNTATTTVVGAQSQPQMVVTPGAPGAYPAYGQPQPKGASLAQPMGASPAQPMGAYPATQPMGAYPAACGPAQLANAPPYAAPAVNEKLQQVPPAYNTVN